VHLRRLLAAVLVLVPEAVAARDIAACADLYRELRNGPEIIGNSREMRRYAQELGQKNTDIRKLRIEMRRGGCGGGSIVKLGAAPDADCDGMRQELDRLEAERDALTSDRRSSLDLVRSGDERGPILAAIRENSCIPSDLEEQDRLEQEERLKVQGISIPSEEPYSGITDMRGTLKSQRPAQKQEAAVAGPPPVPDRPYDPSKKVRTVGPTFFPEQSIDLANPKTPGSQPQQ
jgi:hypothetical protein